MTALVALQVASTPHAVDFRTILQQATERAAFKRELVDFEVDDIRLASVAAYCGLIRVQGVLVTDVLREPPSALRERLQSGLVAAVARNAVRLRELRVDTVTDVIIAGIYNVIDAGYDDVAGSL